MTNYLWHEVSVLEKKRIEREAKEIILKFGDALEKLPEVPDAVVERDESVREEKNFIQDTSPRPTPRHTHLLIPADTHSRICSPTRESMNKIKDKELKETSSTFRDLMLNNSPRVKDDCIVAEKGGWVE